MAPEVLSCKSDRISDLPEVVTDTILSFLPLQEVVRLSILSTKWRYKWIKLKKLVFDEKFCFELVHDKPPDRYKLISIINQILLLHTGPIVEFSLALSFPKRMTPEIDHLMIFLSTCSLQAFTLHNWTGGSYKLHSSIFSCGELRYMYLACCIFTPPSGFVGFPKLVSLILENVVFPVEEEFADFILTCPELENLTLITLPDFHCLALSSPSLKKLYVDGDSCTFLSFGDLPLLQSASFYIDGLHDILHNEETCRFAQFFCCMPALKKLAANIYLLLDLAVGGVPKKLTTALSLETLELSLISLNDLDEVSVLFCLICSCPSIKRVELEICKDYDGNEDEVLDFLKAQVCTADVIFDELREVHLINVLGIEPELEIIKLLLANSPALKTMLIKLREKDDLSRLKLLEKMIRFQRASSMAEIIIE